MVLKQFTRIEMEILTLLGEVRSEIRMQIRKYPGAAAHRLKPHLHHISQKSSPKEQK